MKLPNRERALISPEKLTHYLLNVEHRRGVAKARFLAQFGYTIENWEQLAKDLRAYHVTAEISVVRESIYGTRYEIVAPLQTPSGRILTVRTIWQIDAGTEIPRFITLVPR